MKTVRIIPSKSDAHRALICAALSQDPCRVEIEATSKDIEATRSCLQALCLARDEGLEEAVLPCGESGSTLRFLLPVAGALGIRGKFLPEGRLPQRPLKPLDDQLRLHGCRLTPQGQVPLVIEGKLRGGVFDLPGNVSSQFISGLLFALPVLAEGGEIRLTSPLASAGYVNMTLRTIRRFGITVEEIEKGWSVPGGQHYAGPAEYLVEGDWSNAAFWLAAGLLGREPVRVEGLSFDTAQGDAAVIPILREFGADIWIDRQAGAAEARPSLGQLTGMTIDAEQVPDMVPVLALTAAFAEGTTEIVNAGRLRMKESDRLASVTRLLIGLGARIEERSEGLIITGSGGKLLDGGIADGENDHRIVMTAAAASVACRKPVTILGHQAAAKSYPDFFRVLEKIGLNGNVILR